MTGERGGMTGGQRLRIRGGWLGMTAAKEFLGRTGEGAGTAAGVARCFVFPRLGVFVIFVIKV